MLLLPIVNQQVISKELFELGTGNWGGWMPFRYMEKSEALSEQRVVASLGDQGKPCTSA